MTELQQLMLTSATDYLGFRGRDNGQTVKKIYDTEGLNASHYATSEQKLQKKEQWFPAVKSHRESTAHIALSIRIDKTDNLSNLLVGHGLVARQRQLSCVDILRDRICKAVPFAVGPLFVGRNRIMDHCADTVTAKILLKVIPAVAQNGEDVPHIIA